MNARTTISLRDGTYNVNDKIKDLHMYNDLDYMIGKYIRMIKFVGITSKTSFRDQPKTFALFFHSIHENT